MKVKSVTISNKLMTSYNMYEYKTMKELPINQIIQGDCIKVMRDWLDGCINCVVTSPPYWGLRDYGVDGQLGLEQTPELFIEKMVTVFREVRRVLRNDGTLWLNLGDTSKNKQLVGIPWRVALALQADGWMLRQDIIWHKPSPMPESVKDRCTKAHEYIFLLSKKSKYYFDHEAIAEPCIESNSSRPRMGQGDNTQYNKKRASWNGSVFDKGKTYIHQGERCQKRSDKIDGMKVPSGWDTSEGSHRDLKGRYTKGKHSNTDKQSPWHRMVENVAKARANGASHDTPFGEKRNKRSVWTVASKPFAEAHFATFPPDLIEPCILAGCPKDGVVLDPFMGSGTTGIVAYMNKRNYVGCELNPEYIAIAEKRIQNERDKYALLDSA